MFWMSFVFIVLTVLSIVIKEKLIRNQISNELMELFDANCNKLDDLNDVIDIYYKGTEVETYLRKDERYYADVYYEVSKKYREEKAQKLLLKAIENKEKVKLPKIYFTNKYIVGKIKEDNAKFL